MKTKLIKRRWVRIILLFVFISCFLTVEIYSMAKELNGEAIKKLKVKNNLEGFIEKGGIHALDPEIQKQMVCLKGDVLSVGVIYRYGSPFYESLLYVRNQAQTGEDFAICLIPDLARDIFTIAYEKSCSIRAWGVKIPSSEIYADFDESVYLIVTAKVVRPEVPDDFADFTLYDFEGLKREP